MATPDQPEPSSVFPGFGAISDDPSDLIGHLTDLRRRRGLSQTEAAARMGTSQSALARLESGRADIRLSTLTRYAAALEADLTFGFRSNHPEDP